MQVYRIKDWDMLYENSRSRQIAATGWVPVPNRHDGGGYRRVMQQKDGVAIFGAWILIVQVASRMRPRGTLSNNGRAVDAEELAIRTGAPAIVFERAFEVLCDPAIGWIEQGNVTPASPGCHPDTTWVPVEYQAGGNEERKKGREQKGTERKGKEQKEGSSPELAARPRKPDPIWDTIVSEFFPKLDTKKIPKTTATRIGKVVRDLKAFTDCTPEEIRRRRKRMVREFSEMGDTPESLAKHWSKFGGGQERLSDWSPD